MPQAEDALGLTVGELTEERAQQLNLPEATGIVVEGVETGSKAETAGILLGDVIREINHESISSVDDYQRIMDGIQSEEDIQLFIWRPNAGFLVIKLTK
jgi:serine protease Do